MSRAPALPPRRDRFSDIQEALAAHERRVVEIPERRQAAVLIPLFERDGEPWLVLTKRTETVRSHKGEVSFPGGSKDEADADLWTTAVRETGEELGVRPAALRQLGALDDYPTFSSGYIVSAFVAALERPAAWHPSEHEVADVIELPLRRLAQVWRTVVWSRDGIDYPMHVFDIDGHHIWGVTAFILRKFLDVVGPALGMEGSTMKDKAEMVVKELAGSDDRFDWVGVYWVQGEELVLGPYVGLHPEGHERIPIPEGVCGAVAASGETEVVPDVRARPGHIACDVNTRSEVVAPIRSDERVIGVLDVDSNTLDAFGSAQVEAVEAAAARITER